MKKKKEISIHLIEASYKNIFRSLFSAAYLITGNERMAESILLKIMLANPMPEDKDYDELIESVKEASLKTANPEAGSFFSLSGDMSNLTSPLAEWIFALDEKKARTMILRYGLKLSVKEIAYITGDKPERVKSILEKGKLRSFQETGNQKSSIANLKIACAEVLNASCFPPDYSAVIRSIEKILEDKNAAAMRSFSVKPVISWLVTGALMIFIAVIIWMAVVLIDYFRMPSTARTQPAQTQSIVFSEE